MENQLVKLPAEVEQLAQGVTVEKRNEVQSVLNHVFNGASTVRSLCRGVRDDYTKRSSVCDDK